VIERGRFIVTSRRFFSWPSAIHPSIHLPIHADVSFLSCLFFSELGTNSMSLEEQFAKLTVGDAAGIVDKVKAEGPVKSGLADSIVALIGRCASSEDAEALSGLATVKALAEGAPSAQPFVKDCLGACKFVFDDH
jgi:hypothetical protein